MELEYRLDEINEAAEKFLGWIKGFNIVAFSGEMGSGKTTFIHALFHRMGVEGTKGSPTFSIINEYESGKGPVYHIDLYRCKNEEEAVRAGVEDCLYSGHLCLVEWPSKAPGIFPPVTLLAGISEINETTRKIIVRNTPG